MTHTHDRNRRADFCPRLKLNAAGGDGSDLMRHSVARTILAQYRPLPFLRTVPLSIPWQQQWHYH